MSIFIIDFLKITRKKIIITMLFPLTAALILFFGFIFDEILGLSSNTIVNVIYLVSNYFYIFVFLPLTFIDVDFTPSIIFKLALLSTLIWWYLLSCVLIYLLEEKRKHSVSQSNPSFNEVHLNTIDPSIKVNSPKPFCED